MMLREVSDWRGSSRLKRASVTSHRRELTVHTRLAYTPAGNPHPFHPHSS